MPLSWPIRNMTKKLLCYSFSLCFKVSNELDDAIEFTTRIYALLKHSVHAKYYKTKFANSIILYKSRTFGEQHLRYRL